MKITFRDRLIVFVDLEASGIHQASYPIEIGWSADDEGEPSSFLVRPTSGWTRADFTDAALAIHKIPYETLTADGVSVESACRRLASAWTGAILVSDNPSADGKWLARLYNAADQACPWPLIDFDVITAALAQHAGLSLVNYANAINKAQWTWPIPHRAGPDAQRLHRIARALVDPAFRETLSES